ncbi:reverse transcriptase domain-containing protein [Tanacetum coccineum]|uniref:Reverse transcriptase domain-containing protein n=1 Tax=Tanacetum coccineum TaxID=301880 RepID=A0ABQ5CWZ7_9ASTR
MESMFHICNYVENCQVKPTKIHEAIYMVHDLMDQVVQAKRAKDADNKRKWEDNQGRNSGQNKRHEVVRAYVVGSRDKKGHAGTLPLCDKCNFHHHPDPCAVKCGNSKKVGHQARDCWTPTSVTCYEYGEKGHTRKYCPGLENKNVVRESCQDANVVRGTLLLKNSYIPVLIDTSANSSFVCTAFSQLNNVAPIFLVT